jgi:hypothetical protein
MASKANEQAKSLREVIEQECKIRRFKDVNLVVFNHGVRFEANKMFLYFRQLTNKYIIVLQGGSGYLVNTEFEPHHGESEFLYLSLQDEAQKKNDPILLNFFTYVFYDNNMDEVIDPK